MYTKLLQSTLRLILALVISLSLLGVSAQEARAATFTVTNLLDDGSNGSLRKAITDANTSGGADIISFNVSGTITLTSTLPNISEALTIDGGDQLVTISGDNLYKVLIINTGISVTLNKLSIINGKVGAFTPGGGISNYGTLTVTNCTFSGNQATFGGAIHNAGPATLNVSGSTFLNNSVTDYGGAIASIDATLTVSNSTFSGNHTTADGGAVYGNQNTGTNTMTITNSTFSGNTADGNGGGIENYGGGTLTVVNSTFSGNGASLGGGIHNGTGSILHLKNSILANSTSGQDCQSSAAIASSTNNLMESSTNCGTPVSSADPMLGSLANNGGTTQTFALLPGSPAIDKGDDATCAAAPVNGLDQRGAARTYGTHCDIGAYELKKSSLTSYSAGADDGHILESGENTTTGGTLNSTATTFYLGDEAGDKQYRAILSFDTSSLPNNAVLTRVMLKIRKQGVVGTDPFSMLGGLKVDIRKPYFGTALALALADFNAAAGKSNAATFRTTPVNNWYIAVIGATGYTFINLTGTTQFRLRFLTDDNDDGAADYMKFFSGNYATAAARPTLVIEYYVP